MCRRDQGHVVETPQGHRSIQEHPLGRTIQGWDFFFGREVPTTAWEGNGTFLGTCTTLLQHPGLGDISVLSPGHLPAVIPTQGAPLHPPKTPLIQHQPSPSTVSQPHQLLRVLGHCHCGRTWGERTGHCYCRTLIIGAPGLLEADLRPPAGQILLGAGSRASAGWETSPPPPKSLPRRRTVGYGTRPEVGFKEITISPPG